MSSTINGTDNDENILGSIDVDTLYGNGGDDQLYGFGEDDFLYGGDGDDTLFGGSGDDELHGNAGKDHLRGGFGNDFLYGDEGDDILEGGRDDDFLSGGVGDDRLFGGDGNDTILAGKGKDKVVAGDGDDKIYGEGERDILQGNGGDDLIDGGEGDDVVIGGRGNDYVMGNVGDDSVRGGFGDDVLHGNQGNDTLEGGIGHDTLFGGEGNDRLFAGDGDDIVAGGAGDDKALGGNGNDIVSGGDGHDVLFGHKGEDILRGDAGNDVLWGGDDNDELYGGDDNDALWGQSGNDTLYGGKGNDRLIGGEGNDHLDGGDGDDLLFAGHVTTPSSVSDTLSIRAEGDVNQGGVSSSWTTTTITIDNIPYVVSTSFGVDGAVVVSRVETDGTLTQVDKMLFDSSSHTVITSQRGDITALITDAGLSISGLGNGLTQSNIVDINGTATLFLTSQNSGSITTWHISNEGKLSLDGGLTHFGHSQPHINGGIVRENVSVENADGDVYIYATRMQQDRIDLLTYDPETGAIAETATHYAAGDAVSSVDVITVGGDSFLVSGSSNQVNLFRINAADGSLSQLDVHSVPNGNAPSVNFYQNSDGQVYVISSNHHSESSSLFQLSEHDTLTLADTITGGGAYMSSAGYVDGEPVFVRPNAVDGVDLYTISEGSKFVHQTTVLGIENDKTPPVIVQTIDGDYYLVDADGNRATVKLDINSSSTPAHFDNELHGGAGNDKLDGGNGNDLLIGGSDDDVLYGGEGNDRLVGDNNIEATISIVSANSFSAGGNVDYLDLFREEDISNSGWTTTTTSIDGTPYVVSTQFSVDGVVIISRVEDDGSLSETDRITYDKSEGTVISSSGGDITSVITDLGLSVSAMGNGLSQSNMREIDGQPTLFLTSQNSGSISAWDISDSGQLTLKNGATFGHSQPHINGGIVRENVTFTGDDGTEYIYATRPQNDRIDVLTYDPNTGKITETGNTVAAGVWVSGIDLITTASNTFVAASSFDSINLYLVNSETGNLTLTDSQAVVSGHHHSNSVNFYQTPDGSLYAVSSNDDSGNGSGTGINTASVYKIDDNGQMTLTDTIFGGGAYMSSAGYVDGEPVFVMPNVTEGVDLYTFDRDGSLVLQDTITDISNDWTPPVIVQTGDGSYYLVDADGNDAATAKLDFSYSTDQHNPHSNDTLYGADGDDVLEGNEGDDVLYGGKDNDTLFGGIGDDFLAGDEGFDTLTGGKGNDVFYFDLDSNTDVVTDFTLGQDILRINNQLADIDHISSWQSGADTVLSFGHNDSTVILENFKVTDINNDMFDFS